MGSHEAESDLVEGLIRPSVRRYARVRKFPMEDVERIAYTLHEREEKRAQDESRPLFNDPKVTFWTAIALMVREDRAQRRLQRKAADRVGKI